jgi:tol-pal system protein YbgF
MWAAFRIDVYPNQAMQTLFRAGLFFLIFVAFSPAGGGQCPEGTRNNYKGECVPAASTKKDTQIQQEEVQKWSEPATNLGVIERAVPEDEAKETAGESSSESVVIVEEVISVDEDGSSTAAVGELLTGSLATPDLANALLTIQQLREEIKDLLNRVELQRYEVEKLRGRQRDLYDDLDQRLRKQERLVLTVPVPSMPSVDSIVITPEEPIPAAPTPMVAGTKQPSPNVELSTEGAIEIAVISETEDEKSPVVTVVAETSLTVPAPTPMVAGTDLPIPSPDAGAAVIVLPQVQAETPESEAREESVAVEQMSEGVVTQVTTVVVGPSETDVSESTVESGSATELDAQENQPNPNVVENANAENKMATTAPVDIPAEEPSTAVVTTSVTLGEQDAYDQAFNMLKQSRYEEAAEEFANFLRQYQNSQLTDDAWYWMAEAHYVTRDFERALIGFNTVVSYFVNSPRIPASRLKIGYIQYETSDYEGSRETLTQLLRDFPAHRVAVSAEARLKKMDRERQ